ncbi:MAG TPA: peptide deformylase [Lutibacter sp.]|nr:peptide deformylase [Arcobacter sp.]HIP47873.1 peptide deformylase [Lutibacter sp.]
MIKDLIQYPQTPPIEFNAPVRFFNEDLFNLIDDLKDTMKEHNLNGLSAFQIGNPHSVIVVKDKDNNYIELINSRIFFKKEKITTNETTTYFPDINIDIIRDRHIKVMYEDREGSQKFLDASDEFAVLIQRKIDYNFGANFSIRLNDAKKEQLDMKLEHGIDVVIDNSCPTNFKRDKVLKVINILLAISLIAVFSKYFISDDAIVVLSEYLNNGFYLISSMIIFYTFFAYWEGSKYTNCMSCQIGNIIGTALFHFAKLIALITLKYFII